MAVGAAIALSVVAAGFSVAGGLSARDSAKKEASAQEEQARLANAEARREADRTAKTNDVFRRRQKLAFLKSGVLLEGSPLLVLQETQEESQKEVDAIRARGNALEDLGKRRASVTRSEGRAKLIGSIGQAIGTIGQAGIAASSSGGSGSGSGGSGGGGGGGA